MNDSELEIRDFQAGDYEAVLNVWAQTDMGGAARGDNLESIQNTLKLGGKLLVMIFENQLIGTSWISCDGRRLYLHHFGILPACQGMGLAKPLLEKSLLFAKEKNMQIKLEVHQDNLKATNLYSGAGFTYLGDYRVYIIRNIQAID